MKNKNLISTVLLIALFSVLSFFAGQKMPGKKSQQGFDRAQFGGQGQTRNGQILGEITSVESDKITIKQTDGSSKVILISDQTNIVKTSPSVISDLKIGGKVAIFGKANTEALISAQSIQIDPQNRLVSTTSATIKK